MYVRQPPGFENPKHPDRVFKLSKALYGLKQAFRAWYDRLKIFLLKNDFELGKVDKTIFILRHGNDFLLVQIYVDDIIFGGSSHALVSSFYETMSREFEMNMMEELNYFLGLQIKQCKEGTFIHQMKYTKYLLKRFEMGDCKPIATPMATSHRQAIKCIFRYLHSILQYGIWYSCSSLLSIRGFSDSDFAGCRLDRKSTSSTCHFLGTSLVSWSSRKQSSVAQSTAEAEYVAAASCCSQILWMVSTLKDFGLNFASIPLFCDKTSAINIAKNLVQHSRAKHIDIRYHFLRDHIEKGDIVLHFVESEAQLVDILTKTLDLTRFATLRIDLLVIYPYGLV